jgi:hypothetical protein
LEPIMIIHPWLRTEKAEMKIFRLITYGTGGPYAKLFESVFCTAKFSKEKFLLYWNLVKAWALFGLFPKSHCRC